MRYVRQYMPHLKSILSLAELDLSGTAIRFLSAQWLLAIAIQCVLWGNFWVAYISTAFLCLLLWMRIMFDNAHFYFRVQSESATRRSKITWWVVVITVGVVLLYATSLPSMQYCFLALLGGFFLFTLIALARGAIREFRSI